MHNAQLSGSRVRRRDWQRGAFCSLLLTPRAPYRACRSSATCSMATRGLPSSRYALIAGFQDLSRTEVCSIAILLLIHNAAGRAYILGGLLCQDAQGSNCATTSSVEVLDMSQGAWQSFPVPLGRATHLFQFAMLDDELGASWRTNGAVNDRFSGECGYATTTTVLSTSSTTRVRVDSAHSICA